LTAIILAGGFGTRLDGVIKNLPKPMAPINKKPFLSYILDQLDSYGFNLVIISVYYKSNFIIDTYGNRYKKLNIEYSIDEEPLGTGGAIKNALKYIKNKNVFIINGDTFFDVNFFELINIHRKNKNDVTIGLKRMKNFDRYGFVKISQKGQIISFQEKEFQSEGLIDGGIYVIKKKLFKNEEKMSPFSFTDYIKTNLSFLKVGSKKYETQFIDIGTPEDLKKANKILS